MVEFFGCGPDFIGSLDAFALAIGAIDAPPVLLPLEVSGELPLAVVVKEAVSPTCTTNETGSIRIMGAAPGAM